MPEMSPRELIPIAVVKIAPGKIRPTHGFPFKRKALRWPEERAIGGRCDHSLKNDQ
jgi:hypothetical protein